MDGLASIVIRTYNEERYLPELLSAIAEQSTDGLDVEIVIVDSGSTDRTLDIVSGRVDKVVHIAKEDFSFGRSLNLGCQAASGTFLVFTSAHCVPASKHWLAELVRPLAENIASYSYGRQLGGPESKFSEGQLLLKYFPEVSQVPQEGFFCNNANAALRREVWERSPFDEALTGLEDMHLGKSLLENGHRLAYVAEAPVYHYHHESWSQVKRRYEREAIALQRIMPEVQVGFRDFLRYVMSAILLDSGAALQQKRLLEVFPEIVFFRLMQYWGTYRGNQDHRKLSRTRKERYYYPI
ncbi:PGL/p-HBAD biosynthesis glycosyltransferase [compost metagenome]